MQQCSCTSSCQAFNTEVLYCCFCTESLWLLIFWLLLPPIMGRNAGSKLKPVRLEEESRLCKYYQAKMQQVCKALTFPDKVAAAALMFFKRFYLTFSSLDHDPKNIMLTCIYLACKVFHFSRDFAVVFISNMTWFICLPCLCCAKVIADTTISSVLNNLTFIGTCV